MLDISLRPWKDNIFDPLCRFVPTTISPLHITAAAFLTGLQSCYSAYSHRKAESLFFWALNRFLDCLDGAVARSRSESFDWGGFLYLLGDFIIYSLIPLCTASSFASQSETEVQRVWTGISLLEVSFHINNFVLFYIAALEEKLKVAGKRDELSNLTSLMMRPALIEGVESAVFFTAMLAWPKPTYRLAITMSFLVAIATTQRILWIYSALKRKSVK